MRKLKFDRNKYGNGLLIDTVDMTEFDHSIVEAVPDFHVIGSIERGSGTLRVGQHRSPVRAGTLVSIVPGSHVDLAACKLDRATWLFFEAGFLDLLFEERHFIHKFSFISGPDPAPGFRPATEEFRRCNSLVKELHHEMRDPAPEGEQLLRALLYLLLHRMHRTHAQESGSSVHVVSDHRNLRLRYLLANRVPEIHTVEALAAELGMSRSHLSKLTRSQFGRSPKELIEDQRMVLARRALLFSDADVATIAYDLGYGDPSNFGRSFRRNAGMSPGQFREQATN